jgi:hypothetical protein
MPRLVDRILGRDALNAGGQPGNVPDYVPELAPMQPIMAEMPVEGAAQGMLEVPNVGGIPGRINTNDLLPYAHPNPGVDAFAQQIRPQQGYGQQPQVAQAFKIKPKRQEYDFYQYLGEQNIIQLRLDCLKEARLFFCLPSGIKRKDDTDLINLAKAIEQYVTNTDHKR